MTQTPSLLLPQNQTPPHQALSPTALRIRLTNCQTAIKTFQETTEEHDYSPNLFQDLQSVLAALMERNVMARLTLHADTRSYLAHVSVPEPTNLPTIGGVHLMHGTATDRNPVVAVLYALHFARGGTLDEQEYHDEPAKPTDRQRPDPDGVQGV